MAFDDLTPDVVRSSATMVLVLQTKWILVPKVQIFQLSVQDPDFKRLICNIYGYVI